MAGPLLLFANRKHLKDIISIDYDSYLHAWDEKEFIENLKKRNCVAKVLEIDDKVVGYGLWVGKKSSFEILRLAIHSEYRRKGYGSILLKHVLNKTNIIPARQEVEILLEDTNIGGHLFLKANGLKAEKIIASPFDDCDSDGYLFKYRSEQLVEA